MQQCFFVAVWMWNWRFVIGDLRFGTLTNRGLRGNATKRGLLQEEMRDGRWGMEQCTICDVRC